MLTYAAGGDSEAAAWARVRVLEQQSAEMVQRKEEQDMLVKALQMQLEELANAHRQAVVQGRADAARSSQEIEAAVLEQMKARHVLEQQLETERAAHLKAAQAVRELEAQVQQEQMRANSMQQLSSSATEREGTLLKRAVRTRTYA